MKDGVAKLNDDSVVDLDRVVNRSRRNPRRDAASAIKLTYSSSEDENEDEGGDGGSRGDHPSANYQGDALYIPGENFFEKCFWKLKGTCR